ncbi:MULTISPECIES: flavin reductase family protein [unclassified Enterobacter]|jgi:flavin reductase (DIM6/NTAB) family NADH-FMN oxidoreductase RutF|uniref:flavin reductase family protein n=1 Tax=unclassified Enterobacter TaxID=2608935 RepID=UPI0015C8A216|nr:MULTISPECIES: flavin reductase family protein [unclassified Enterobacter]MBB3304870.1 flavin reductase (DIM6/NTAB) family NADH-FMN oxidoreductase RutF [Enterobacter sp. Sphag1F]NYI13686.1 flavin reductase (DIM6/NTAB) family NADH-FMN oxidoreductase RutF [Enterobacter sp. Sphag71]
MHKIDFPVSKARKYLEPGPVVLLSSQFEDHRDIMTLGWHTILEFSPSLVGCMIAGGNYSHELIRQSGQCVINVPSANLVDNVVAIGNSHGDRLDKFDAFNLTPEPASVVNAPLIDECFASFECQLYDDSMVDNYNLFIFEIVKAHVAETPEFLPTLHYTGEGRFSVMSNLRLDKRSDFKPEMLI